MKVDVVLGLQWGDEGKGKIVDVLANSYPVIARFQGGPNAGHSLHFEGKKFVLHTVPSGVFRKNATNIIGNGSGKHPCRTNLKSGRKTNQCRGNKHGAQNNSFYLHPCVMSSTRTVPNYADFIPLFGIF